MVLFGAAHTLTAAVPASLRGRGGQQVVTDPAAQTQLFSPSPGGWKCYQGVARLVPSEAGRENPSRASSGSGGLLALLVLPGLWTHQPVSACIGIGCPP